MTRNQHAPRTATRSTVLVLLFCLGTIGPAAASGRQEIDRHRTAEENKHEMIITSGSEEQDTQEMRETPGSDWETVSEGQTVTVVGRVRLVGSEPFSETVITDADGRDWYLSDDAKQTLSGYEQQKVAVTGTVHLHTMELADGRKLANRRQLTHITIVQ